MTTASAASTGNTDGVVVTFEPTSSGVATAMLVLETNDPVHPILEIPIVGNGAVDPIEEGPDGNDLVPGSGAIQTCGCSQSSGAPALLLPLLGLLALRRRRA